MFKNAINYIAEPSGIPNYKGIVQRGAMIKVLSDKLFNKIDREKYEKSLITDERNTWLQQKVILTSRLENVKNDYYRLEDELHKVKRELHTIKGTTSLLKRDLQSEKGKNALLERDLHKLKKELDSKWFGSKSKKSKKSHKKSKYRFGFSFFLK